jgi:NAD(P)-dependent dehydrogenase (short-subunit alcohol dehydrogenase family)
MAETNGLRTFAGAVAIITGGASGIGRALGEALAQRGAVVVLADRQADVAAEVAAGIRTSGGQAAAVELDVTDFAAFQRVVHETVTAHGRLDYLFNNAGIGIGGEVRYYQIEDWNAVLDVNLGGVVHGVQAAYPVMVEQGFGHIVNTASMAGLIPSAGIVSYCATKHAVVGLSTSLRVEAARFGVRVSVLCPGVIRTPILEGGKYGKQLRPISLDKQRKRLEMLRPMTPEKFAPKVLRAVAKNKPIIVVPAWWKLLWWINRLSPALGLLVARRMFKETLQMAEEEAPLASV